MKLARRGLTLPKARISGLEEAMVRDMGYAKLPPPVREHRFHPARRWRFDFAWPDARIALEVEGGTWTGGRHTRGAGYEADAEKYNAAALLGWRVFRVTGGMVQDGRALKLMCDVFGIGA